VVATTVFRDSIRELPYGQIIVVLIAAQLHVADDSWKKVIQQRERMIGFGNVIELDSADITVQAGPSARFQ